MPLNFDILFQILSFYPGARQSETTHWREESSFDTRPLVAEYPLHRAAVSFAGSVKEKNRKYVQTKLAYRNCKNLLEIREENLFVHTN